MIDSDIDTLDELCSPLLIYTHSRGERDTKESYLAAVRSGHIRYEHIDHPIEKVVVGDGCALVWGEMHATAWIGHEKRTLANSAFAVWMRTDGAWRLAGYQPTPLPVT
jgi:hypothetical protein